MRDLISDLKNSPEVKDEERVLWLCAIRTVNRRTDIVTACCLLYELLSGPKLRHCKSQKSGTSSHYTGGDPGCSPACCDDVSCNLFYFQFIISIIEVNAMGPQVTAAQWVKLFNKNGV